MGRRDKSIASQDTENLLIGQRMRQCRQVRGISLSEMAKRLDYTKSYLSGVENCKVQAPPRMVRGYEKELGLVDGELSNVLHFQQPPLATTDQSISYQHHFDLLKQGVEPWNRWREERTAIRPSLARIKLSGMNLSKANLNGADFTRADLDEVNLSDADLSESILRQCQFRNVDLIRANLRRAFLSEAKFSNVNLEGANLSGADLSGADLSGADLSKVDLSESNLSGSDLSLANLSEADLSRSNLRGANLLGADLSYATVTSTIFGDIDLRQVRGLSTVRHIGPSTVGIDTLYRSQGAIPEVFLRGAGIPDSYITYMHALSNRPMDYYTCFISYSSKDQDFAERLYVDLQAKGIRCWFAPEDLKIGDSIRSRIDESVQLYDKLVLVLSEHSVGGAWVEKEVESALEKESLQNKTVLFPIRLDEAVMQTSQAWAADIRRMRHIADFSKWREQDKYQLAIRRLLRDLSHAPKPSASMRMGLLAEEAVTRWAETLYQVKHHHRRSAPDLLFTDKDGNEIGVEVKYYAHPRSMNISSLYELTARIQPSLDKLILAFAFPEEYSAREAASFLAKLENVPSNISFLVGYIQQGEFQVLDAFLSE
jgi:uncharacterized protein YjbI with pentapeptide repeats